jgi:hypothetical protein
MQRSIVVRQYEQLRTSKQGVIYLFIQYTLFQHVSNLVTHVVLLVFTVNLQH